MISPRWRKVTRDLWLNLPSTLLVVIAIAVGIFGVGFVLDASSILTREIDANYKMAKPSSATLWMDKVDTDVVKTARAFPGVAEAEAARSSVRGRVQIGPNEWDVMRLFVIDDFNDQRINKFFPESGSWPPGDRQILVERASLPIINAKRGNSIVVRVLGGSAQAITVAGTVFDPGQDPAWVNNITCGYVKPSTLKWLGGAAPSKGLSIVVSKAKPDRSHIRNVANRLSTALQRKGYSVKRIEVPVPGKYQQTEKVNSLLVLLEAFGLLCLVLSGFMAATLVSALLSQQIRQIGVMKAVGARLRQIMGIYLATVAGLSLAASAIGIPLAAIAGRGFALSAMKMLNFNVTNSALPHWVYFVQISVGILTPLLTAVYPVYRGSRITVREAIRDYGVSLKNFGANRFDNLWGQLRGVPRPLALSLRNTFRRRGRTVLTMAMLVAGGTAFIASLGSAASWNKTIDKSFANVNYDIDVRFGQPYPTSAVEKSIRTVPGVTAAEAWGYMMPTAFPKYSDGTYGAAFAIFAPKDKSTLIKPAMIEGRWLRADDTNAVVVDNDFTDNAAKQGTPVKVGDELTLNLNDQDTTWHVVGIMDKIGLQSAAYVNYDRFAEVTHKQGLATCARVVVRGHDKTLQKTVSRALERKLAKDGFSVFVIQSLTASRQIMINHVILILFFLMLMSILIAVVGALGLASTMGVNVMERAREIGIMRSIGASTRMILLLVITEGVGIGVLSWLLGSIISVPVTNFIARNAGQFIFPRVMDVVIPLWAPVLWLVIVLGVASAASFYPAWRATRLTVREVLTYE